MEKSRRRFTWTPRKEWKKWGEDVSPTIFFDQSPTTWCRRLTTRSTFAKQPKSSFVRVITWASGSPRIPLSVRGRQSTWPGCGRRESSRSTWSIGCGRSRSALRELRFSEVLLSLTSAQVSSYYLRPVHFHLYFWSRKKYARGTDWKERDQNLNELCELIIFSWIFRLGQCIKQIDLELGKKKSIFLWNRFLLKKKKELSRVLFKWNCISRKLKHESIGNWIFYETSGHSYRQWASRAVCSIFGFSLLNK